MKLVAVVCFCVIATLMFTTQAAPQTTSDKFDNIDIDSILNNDRLLTNYFKCLMDTGKCTKEGEELKRRLPEAIETKCGDCTEKQKESVKKIIKFLVEKKNDMWMQLTEKYDPTGMYKQKYEEDAKNHGIAV